MELDPKLEDIIDKLGLAEFKRHIRSGRYERSYEVAKRSVIILNNLVKSYDWSSAKKLIEALYQVCEYIDSWGLVETAVGNMIRRVMRIVRDECLNFKAQNQNRQAQDEETNNFTKDEIANNALDLKLTDADGDGVKDNILEAIEQELLNELELSSKSISSQAMDYVQADETILTLGKSKVIESFIRHAANGSKTGRRKFVVIVVSLAPFYSGHEMAKNLNKHGIETIIIPDSAVFAIMSRVNKVIIGTHSMMANGGLKAPAGAHSVALAAKHYSVPMIVCCPMYKLTPQYLVSHDSDAFRQFSHIHSTVPEPYTSSLSTPSSSSATEPSLCSTTAAVARHCLEADENDSKKIRNNNVKSDHSTFDYVPPELITLFVSNIGGNSPSYVYQLLNELYCKSDYLTSFN